MEADLQSGQMLSTFSYTIDGVTRTFRSFKEWQDFYGFVCSKAAAETATTTAPLGRVYARPLRRS